MASAKWILLGVAVLVGVGVGAAYALSPKLTVSFPKTVSHSQTVGWTGSGFTPLSQVQAQVLTNNGTLLIVLSPNSVSDSSGNVSGSFVVGGNISSGNNQFILQDLTTGNKVSTAFTVA